MKIKFKMPIQVYMGCAILSIPILLIFWFVPVYVIKIVAMIIGVILGIMICLGAVGMIYDGLEEHLRNLIKETKNED